MAELSVMDRINMILSDPEKATMTLAQIVSEEIREFKASPEYAIMLEAESYYRNRSDVQRKTVDVANRSNTKIEHPILKKLVDQKANYLLSKPWTVDTKNSAYGEALTKVFDQTFRRKIKSLGKGAIKSGIAWIQPYSGTGNWHLCVFLRPNLSLCGATLNERNWTPLSDFMTRSFISGPGNTSSHTPNSGGLVV